MISYVSADVKLSRIAFTTLQTSIWNAYKAVYTEVATLLPGKSCFFRDSHFPDHCVKTENAVIKP